MRRATLVRLGSYVVLMGVGTLLDVLAVTALLADGVWTAAAVSVGFGLNVSSGYILGRFVVFRSPRVPPGTSMLRYGALVVLNVLVAVGGVSTAVALGVPYLVGRLISSGALVPTNYVVMHHWVFGTAAPANPTKHPREGSPAP